jgi:hypothetical protein
VDDEYKHERLYRRRQARRLPWQMAGIVAVMGGVAAALQQLWLPAGGMVLIGAGLLLFSLTR